MLPEDVPELNVATSLVPVQVLFPASLDTKGSGWGISLNEGSLNESLNLGF